MAVQNQYPQDKTKLAKGLFIRTYGCQMNEYDSQKVAALLSKSYRVVNELKDADVVFINTCSIREKAEHKLSGTLGQVSELKRAKPSLIIGVGGCVAQQEGGKIIKKNSNVDFVVGTHNLSLVPSLIANAEEKRGPQVAVDYREDWEELPDDFLALPVDEAGKVQTEFLLGASPVRALVAIQRGCNKHCAFCVVPTTRGPEVSRAPLEILREVRAKVAQGASEILLLGQTVNSYGRDLSPRFRFEQLIEQIAEIDGVKRIRFISPHPADVRPSFIELYGNIPKLCRHIHLPLQAGSNRVLKAMNRNYRKERYLDIVHMLRERCPDIAISADIIVGFPTETEEEFAETLEVMRLVRYHSVYSFVYSRRPNTEAKLQYSPNDEVPIEVARDRLLRLQALQEEISSNILNRYLGTEVEVLLEGQSRNIKSLLRGRNEANTIVEIVGDDLRVGDMVSGVVEHVSPYGLRARAVSQKERDAA